jgi:hypothetical protein
VQDTVGGLTGGLTGGGQKQKGKRKRKGNRRAAAEAASWAAEAAGASCRPSAMRAVGLIPVSPTAYRKRESMRKKET